MLVVPSLGYGSDRPSERDSHHDWNLESREHLLSIREALKSPNMTTSQEALNLLYKTWSPSRHSANSYSLWFPRDGKYTEMR